MQQAFGHLSETPNTCTTELWKLENLHMQCSSPESFASVDHAQPGEDHRSVLRTTLSKITLYNFAAAHSLNTPIELTERLLLCILLANEDRHLSRTELHQITKINPSTIDSALLNLEQRNEVHTLPQHAPEQTSYELTASGHTVAISLESWTTSFYRYAECGSDAGVRDLLHQLQRAIYSLIATNTIPTTRACIACDFFAPESQTGGYCRFLSTPLTIQTTRPTASDTRTP